MKTASEYSPVSFAIDACAYLLRKSRLTTPELSVYIREHHDIVLAASTLAKLRCQDGGSPSSRRAKAIRIAK